MKQAFGIIYLHKNKLNGKCYIGQTCQPSNRRWRRTGTNYNIEVEFIKDTNGTRLDSTPQIK